MRDRIRTLLSEVLDVPASEVPADATSEELELWDSLNHLALMLAIEAEFGVEISSEAMPELLSLEAIEAHLREQGVPA